MTTLELYRLDIENSQFERVGSIETYRNLQYFNKLNTVGGCLFSLDVYDNNARQSLLTRYANHVAVKRNGVVIWFGPIININGNFTDVNGEIQIEALSQLGHLKTRYTAGDSQLQSLTDAGGNIVNYNEVDAGAIAWDLINTTQNRTNGELMIRQGNIDTTVNRVRTYENTEIAYAIENLTKVIGGFDFLLTPRQDSNGLVDQITFGVFESLGTVRDDYELNLYNTKSIQFSSKSNLYNSFKFLGAGTGEDIYTTTTSNASFQKGYTRREAVVARKDISINETLDEKAAEALREEAPELWNIQFYLRDDVDPSYNRVNVGDTIKYNLKTEDTSFVDFKGTARVLEKGVMVDDNGSETIILALKFIL